MEGILLPTLPELRAGAPPRWFTFRESDAGFAKVSEQRIWSAWTSFISQPNCAVGIVADDSPGFHDVKIPKIIWKNGQHGCSPTLSGGFDQKYGRDIS